MNTEVPSAVVGAVALVALGVLGVGGAAVSREGLLIGWPGLAVAGGAALGVGLLAAWRRARPGLALCAGLLPPVVLLLAGLTIPGVRALSGGPLLALALAGLALVLARAGWRPPRWTFVPAVFLVYTVAAGRVQLQVGPRGDEPHYLMVADSLLRDGDLALEPDYAEVRYGPFHDAPLEPHYRVRGRGGVIYSLHAVGLSMLILPAYALAGYPGASLFMALLAALLAGELRAAVASVTRRDDLAEATGWAFAFSPPLVHYAGLVFTEVPAALAILVALRRSRKDALSGRGALAVGLLAAALPWLNVRYAPLAAILLLHALWRHPRLRAGVALLGPALLSAGGLALYHFALYGFFDPRRVYGRRPEFALATLRDGLPGLFFDQEFGLLVYAPVLALAVPGLVHLWRRDLRLAVTALALVGVVVLTAGTWHMWRGGWNPPGRFLVPVAAVLALAVAAAWERRGLTAGAALLLGWTLWTGLAGAAEPRLVHRDRDDTAPLFRLRSGALEWTGLLPAYVLSEPDRRLLALVWAAALAAALPWRRRPATAGRVAVATVGLLAAAQGAAAVSDARSGGRDAVRVVGRPAVTAPGWRLVPSAAGVWGTRDLEWGPLYEPHRHPGGAEIGSRLALRPGAYALVVTADDLSGSGARPLLEVRPDGSHVVSRWTGLRWDRGELRTVLDVEPTDRAVTLRLHAGGALLLREIRLEAQPSAPAPVQLREGRG